MRNFKENQEKTGGEGEREGREGRVGREEEEGYHSERI